MATQVLLEHITRYRYSRGVRLGPQVIRLKPAAHCRTPILSYSLNITPKNHFLNWQQDPFGNFQARAVFPEPTEQFEVKVGLRASLERVNPFDFFIENDYLHFPFKYEKSLAADLRPYLTATEKGPHLMKFVAGIGRKKRHIIDLLSTVNQTINRQSRYLVRLEPGVQSPEETLQLLSGSCRDLAWLACQALRHLGVASRFASGYLIQLVADEKPVTGPSGPEMDFTDPHAWVEAYIPGAGWVGMDPTSGLFAGEGHIPLSCTPHPVNAAPISGTVDPCESALEHLMSVRRVSDPPRAGKPMTDDQWAALDALGQTVDRRLEELGAGLTLGGEPTFVSASNRDDLQWQTGALGAEKLSKGWDLLSRLRKQFSPGSVAQTGQGKWYGGEPLPRWSLNSFWRKDGEPVWVNQALLADPSTEGRVPANAAQALAVKLAQDLGLSPSRVFPAYESAAASPVPAKAGTSGAAGKPVQPKANRGPKAEGALPAGWVLPLTFSLAQDNWVSEAWRFTTDRLTLVPGDSPLGYRLPLDSIVFDKPLEPTPLPQDPFQEIEPLLPRQKLNPQVKDGAPKGRDAKGAVRTALGVQLRNGQLHVFLPPLSRLEHFLELVARIEGAAGALHLSLVLEGYEPPADPRLLNFRITPDPGVLEVNIHPAANWAELKANTEILYEQARQAGLSAVKFTINGRPVGSGGGSHLVLGAALPDQSPFFREPRLLPAMIAYWQRHPSLSYFFSSLFVGPTSQAPRPDEARHDALYELENAMRRIPAEGPLPFWRLDRLFRHLLVDVSGNTHRAEFCIDKLYSPDSTRGRQGLLELRAFEMAPHPRMALLQILLVRALLVRLYRSPLPGKLTRWGTALNDRFMLPWYLWQDLLDILEDLKREGMAFDPEWFRAHYNFRFPLCGKTVIEGAELELRTALEPWPVLGEEQIGGATSRAIDASTERVQVLLRDAPEGWVLSCNGRRVPLQSTQTPGLQVAGIRYKAWDQPSSLYADIPATQTLELDLLDPIRGISLGGCLLHTFHPGGRSYERMPVNEEEAESRWKARFEPLSRVSGKAAVPPEETNPDFPHTLDLRRL
ncbi:MAG TPA: transglutaminase family protein [bacterium]|nr:transglutaminase family protein [bacterium]